jgi:hypothetical protein
MAAPNKVEIESAKTISGLHTLFNASFILEFLQPPASLNASVLMRAKYTHSSSHLGKSHPQAPPLHLHFSQKESFYVKSGIVGTTSSYSALDRKHVGESDIVTIDEWEPHRFWPHPEASGDSVMYVWAHPDETGKGDEMDRAFFENLLRYLSDVVEGKKGLDLVQVMLMQHVTASALVVFPTLWWLGPMRWWVPWKVQGMIAWVGTCFGYRALMREYTGEEEWEEYVRLKKA